MDDRHSWQAPNPTATVGSVDSAVRSLVGRWERRQRWEHLLGCYPPSPPPRPDPSRSPWRTRLARFLESTPVHVATIALILVDLALTALDLSSSLVSCSRGDRGHEEGRAEKVYRWVGVAIVGVLCARVAALAVALGWSFLRSPGRVLDAVVVVGALLLEVLEKGVGGEAGGLLVVVSLWRVVRVVETALELSDEAIEAEIERVVAQVEGVRDENRRVHEELVEMEKRVAELQGELDRVRMEHGKE